jgi:hypothetical protein
MNLNTEKDGIGSDGHEPRSYAAKRAGTHEDAPYPEKRSCTDGGRKIALLVDCVFRVVLPTVDDTRLNGKRYLRCEDELAFAEAMFPAATAIVKGRWFWLDCDGTDNYQFSYEYACLAAGARRMLMGLWRGLEAGAASEFRERLCGLALEAFRRGSSRWLAVLHPEHVWEREIQRERPAESCIVAEYVRHTSEPDAVVRRVVSDNHAERLLDKELALVECINALVTRGHCDVALRFAQGHMIAKRAGDMLTTQLSAKRPMSEVRLVLAACRGRGMLDCDLAYHWFPRLADEIPVIFSSPEYDADDAEWLLDSVSEIARRGVNLCSFSFVVETCHDPRKLACLARYRDTCRADFERAPLFVRTGGDHGFCASFVRALGLGKADVLEHLKPVWEMAPPARRSSLLCNWASYTLSVDGALWLLRNTECLDGVALAAVFSLGDDPRMQDLVRSWLRHPQFADMADNLAALGCFHRRAMAVRVHAALLVSFHADVTMDALLWTADLTGSDPAALFARTTHHPTAPVCDAVRKAARSHPEWFNHQQLLYLLQRNERDLVDALAGTVVADDIARNFAAAHTWLREGLDPWHIRMLPWLARRGHHVAAVSEKLVETCVARVADAPQSLSPTDITAVTHLISPAPVAPDRRASWCATLAGLSRRGYAGLALLLADVVGVAGVL